MTKELFIQAMVKFILGVLLVGVLLFLPAGTMSFWKGWLLMGILFIPMFLAGLVMMIRNPELLQKRLRAKEGEAEQKQVIRLSGLMFVLGFLLAGLDIRFSWCPLPGFLGGCGRVFACVPDVCRGIAGEYMAVQDC